jgi:copper ion binding protein
MKAFKILFLITATILFVAGCGKTEASTTAISVKSAVCETCVYKIETAVKNIDGVKSVNLDLNTHMANVSFDKSKTDLSAIENAIVMAGYSANGNLPNQKALDDLPQCCKLTNEI